MTYRGNRDQEANACESTGSTPDDIAASARVQSPARALVPLEQRVANHEDWEARIPKRIKPGINLRVDAQ